MLYYAIAGILTIFGSTNTMTTISIHIAGGETVTDVKAIMDGKSTFVSLDDMSKKMGIEAKDIGDGMIGLCKGDLCTPVELDNKNDARRDLGKLMINAELMAQAMGSEARWVVPGRDLEFTPGDHAGLDALVKIGDAVPNFSLPSLIDGKMVSLSSFRGKRILLFMWASW